MSLLLAVLIMSKKKVFFLSYLVFAMGLFSNFVSAAEPTSGLEGAFGTIRNLFGFLPDVINLEKLVGGDAAAVFWAKFLVWLLLFAILYFGTTAIPRLADNKRIATVIALVISLMAALLIPNAIVINIFQTYGLVAGILLWFIPLGFMFYLNHVIQVRWLRVLVLLLALIILVNINTTLVSHDNFLGSTGDYFGLLLGIVLIMFLWNLFAAVGGEDRAEGARGWAGDHIRDGWNWATRPREERERRERERVPEGDINQAEELNRRLEELERQLRDDLRTTQDDEIERLRILAELINQLRAIQEELRTIRGFV